MSIEKINSNLPITTKIDLLNSMILELNGLIAKGTFNINEIAAIYTELGSTYNRQFLRNQVLGHTLATYTGWTHSHAETGYSIWKYSPTNYKYNSVNQLYFDNKVFENRGEASSETATTFDKIFLHTGSIWIDDTSEVTFDLLADTDDYLYVGLSTTFAGIAFEFDTRGSNNTLFAEYWNGSVWTELDISGATYVDDTSNFESDGRIYWTLPGNWATTTVNGVASKYWARIYTSTLPVTTAIASLVQPANSVISLLQLSSDEIFNEDWAWCSYGTAVYITLRNTGASAYEGDYFISTSSSAINKQNYWISNHEVTADYEDATF
jgi:hypothetical protein